MWCSHFQECVEDLYVRVIMVKFDAIFKRINIRLANNANNNKMGPVLMSISVGGEEAVHANTPHNKFVFDASFSITNCFLLAHEQSDWRILRGILWMELMVNGNERRTLDCVIIILDSPLFLFFITKQTRCFVYAVRK